MAGAALFAVPCLEIGKERVGPSKCDNMLELRESTSTSQQLAWLICEDLLGGLLTFVLSWTVPYNADGASCCSRSASAVFSIVQQD